MWLSSWWFVLLVINFFLVCLAFYVKDFTRCKWNSIDAKAFRLGLGFFSLTDMCMINVATGSITGLSTLSILCWDFVLLYASCNSTASSINTAQLVASSSTSTKWQTLVVWTTICLSCSVFNSRVNLHFTPNNFIVQLLDGPLKLDIYYTCLI